MRCEEGARVMRRRVEEAHGRCCAVVRHPDRQSVKVVEYGEKVIEGCNIARRLGDEQWSFLEQVGLAALDVGNMDLAGVRVALAVLMTLG